MAKIHGKVALSVAGVRYNVKDGSTLKLSGDVGTPVVGDAGFAGMQYAAEAGQVDCTIIASDDVNAETLKAIKDVQLSFDSDNGQSFISADCSRGALPELSKEGWKMVFHGTFKAT